MITATIQKNQQEETPNQKEKKQTLQAQPSEKRNGDTQLGYSG
jgi:hypothetical protein